MTKSKKTRISIKIKIWLSILLTAVLVIAAVWVLLMMSISDYYVRVRRDGFSDLLSTISTTLDSRGMFETQNELRQFAGKNHLCIVVVRSDGLMQEINALPYNCYVHRDDTTLTQFLSEAVQQQSRIQVRIISDADASTDYLIGSIQSQSTRDGSYVAVITQTLDSAADAITTIQRQLIYISVLLLVIATLIAFLVSRSLTNPLLKVTAAARQIADGRLNVTVDVKSRDEIGDLADNFNLMSKEISRVNVLQRELVANISHDMRTPLTMIKGYAETIKDITGDDPETRNQQLDIIVDESNRLSALVSSVMDLSLMQAGQIKLQPSDFDITAKVQDILGRFQLLEQLDGFEFLLEADRPYFVHADEVRIEQVLYNLINNAVNHIGETKRITVRIYPFEGKIRIEVIDTGTGIPQEDLPLIWDRYYKPFKKTGKELGTGLGLSIVKAVLINHRSRFGVVSTLGVGSRFWFTLKPGQAPEGSVKSYAQI